MKGTQVAAITPGEAKLEFRFPSGENIRIVARHHFSGNSQWNNVHGAMKYAKMRGWGDIYVQGHKHCWAAHMHESSQDHQPKWSIIVKGFKDYDSFAENKGFYRNRLGHYCCTILDPNAPPTERVRMVWDIEEAADLLTFLRRRSG